MRVRVCYTKPPPPRVYQSAEPPAASRDPGFPLRRQLTFLSLNRSQQTQSTMRPRGFVVTSAAQTRALPICLVALVRSGKFSAIMPSTLPPPGPPVRRTPGPLLPWPRLNALQPDSSWLPSVPNSSAVPSALPRPSLSGSAAGLLSPVSCSGFTWLSTPPSLERLAALIWTLL